MISNLILTEESFESLFRYYSISQSKLKWDLVFTLPAWLKAWWQCFGAGAQLYLRVVKQNNTLLGIAPLQIRKDEASIIGSVNVCDYQDFITVPGSETEFYNAILDDLQRQGIKSLRLETIRPDSSVALHLVPLAQSRNIPVNIDKVDVSLDMSLPFSFEAYLESLDGKQRHEIRRKLRRLQAAGDSVYRVISNKADLLEATGVFLQLFPDYRRDKAEFLTTEMQNYFRVLAESLAESDILRFGVLESNRKVVAMIMYFDYRENIYLYNSAYHPDYKNLSVGIISKVRCIQDNIEKKKAVFDFLKGHEQYKYYLGGHEIPLYCCRINLS